MGEIGLVISAEKNMVTVRLERTEACAKCRACTAGFSKNEMLIRANNICGAAVDDYVNIELSGQDFLLAVIIMYGTPFLALISGIAAGIAITGNETASFFTGIFLMCLMYLVIRSKENYFKSKNYVPTATEIVVRTHS